jgi:hypothetical protein
MGLLDKAGAASEDDKKPVAKAVAKATPVAKAVAKAAPVKAAKVAKAARPKKQRGLAPLDFLKAMSCPRI